MRSVLCISLAFLGLILGQCLTALAADPPSGTEEVLTDAAIIEMAKAQLGESVIIAKIKASRTAFDTSVNSLIALKKAGVSDKVIEAMLESQNPRSASASGERESLHFQKMKWTRGESITSIAFSPDGKMVASADTDGIVILGNVETREMIRKLKGHSRGVLSVAFSPDGKMLASSSRDDNIILWGVPIGERIGSLHTGMGWNNSVAFSPDGKMLASAALDRSIILWDVNRERASVKFQKDSGFGGVKNRWKGHSQGIYSIAFSPDGKTLLSGSQDGSIILWEVPTGNKLRTLQGHRDYVYSVAFSPDGRILASGGRDTNVILWDPTTGQRMKDLSAHTSYVLSVAFSPDGKMLASGSQDKTVILWDVMTGSAIQTLAAHANSVTSVAFSPDGKALASGGAEGVVLLWNLPKGK